jgi:metallo-beta-lactamase class B
VTGHRCPGKAIALVAACAFLFSLAAMAVEPSWTRPVAPERIVGNLYYVGSEELASFLIVTPQGNILINSTLAENVPMIRRNVEALGFHFSDIKILLISHAHSDHCGGSARVKRLTGAQYEVMDADVPVVESGGKADFLYGDNHALYFEPSLVDRILHDNDTVTLGEMTLTAHLTAGHTRGTTTWTFDERDGERTVHVVIVGGPNVNEGSKLVGDSVYPNITADFQHGFDVLKGLPCDVFLGAHGSFFGLMAKLARARDGDGEAFIDPNGYRDYIADREQAFQAELKRQQALAQSQPVPLPQPGSEPVKSQ